MSVRQLQSPPAAWDTAPVARVTKLLIVVLGLVQDFLAAGESPAATRSKVNSSGQE